MAAVLPVPPHIATKRIATPVGIKSASTSFSFGKYREIIVAVALFLLFDLGVLVLNFYTSYQISEDALGINLAGRQRMLTQRSAKALLAVEAAHSQGRSAAEDLDELRNAVHLFDSTLKAFEQGGTVPGGNGKSVQLQPAQGSQATEALQQAQALWTPFQPLLAPVLAGYASPAELQAASAYAQAHNQQLLGQMNTLTTALEATASDRATTLRLVQTGGIALALLNFAFILFKFLRRLRHSDAAIEAVTEENREILLSVREGLFLITPRFQLGSQASQSAHQMFGQTLHAGDDFFALLDGRVPDKTLQDAKDYVELLFAPHVKEALVQDINPLTEVHLTGTTQVGKEMRRALSFRFNRVRSGLAVEHLLVTVQDISERMLLQEKLQAERLRSQKEMAMLLAACDADPALLRKFVERAEASLLEVNDLLRSTAYAPGKPALRHALDQSARRIHAFKGDAGALGLESLMQQAHTFESELLQIRTDEGGDRLLALPIPLEELLSKVAALKNLCSVQRGSQAKAAYGALNTTLAKLAQDVAHACGKRVHTTIQMEQQPTPSPETADLLREIATQLVRNAVVHGIEAPATRQASGKSAAGTLDVQLAHTGSEWVLRVRDDGKGLNAAAIRQRLLDLGWYNTAQLDSFDDRQIVSQIFKPGFSTVVAQATVHAGRGIGLDLVQSHVQRLGGRLTLASTPGLFTEFAIRFEA